MRRIFTLIAVFYSFFLFAANDPIVIKVLDKNLDKEEPEYEFVMKIISKLNETNRIDIFLESADSTGKVVTYICEIVPNYKQWESEFKLAAKNDSTQMATYTGKYHATFGFDMVLTSVETGIVEKVFHHGYRAYNDLKLTYKYKDIGIVKGLKNDSPKQSKANDLAKRKSKKEIDDTFKSVRRQLMVITNNNAKELHYAIFPFRANITESVEIKNDYAKTVKINAGKELDIYPKSRLVAYTVENKEVNGRKFERFKLLGNIKYEDTDDGVCDVTGKRAGKRILTALNNQQEIFVCLGRTPYTLSQEMEKINLALISNSIPGINEEQNKLANLRLRNAIGTREQFTVIERENFEKILAEKEAQKSEDFLDKNTLDQFSSKGADMILEVNFGVPSLNVNEHEFEGMKRWAYSAKYPYSMKLLDVATGELVSETSDFYYKNFYQPINTPKKGNDFIVEKTLPSISFDLKEFFNKAVPPSIVIIEIVDEKKDKAKKVLVAGDLNDNLGVKYFVTQKTMVDVDGELLPRFETIGEIILTEKMGEGLMVGYVKEGEKEIYTALNNDDILYVADKKGFFDKLNNFSKGMIEKFGY
jgi:hypothetical protein